jgi:hypothetical protein
VADAIQKPQRPGGTDVEQRFPSMMFWLLA